jgi:acetylornithine/N-succinyldiaminopimelate aminotransferase
MSNYRQLFLQHLGQTSISPLLLEIEKAEGVYLYGPSGEMYMDLISGVSVSNTGHRHPKVVKAIKDQVDSYMHLMVYGEMVQSPQVRYALRLTGLLPEHLNSCFFVNSGSEAVEGALKLAKRYTGRSRIVSFKNAYHGSTHGAMSIQGSDLFTEAFRPLLPDVYKAEFNNEDSLNLIENNTACVIVEPIQAEAGVTYPVINFLAKIKSRCEEAGALLVFDEIQTGFGRTGSLFYLEQAGVVPDILLLAKALGGGLPLGAFISSREIMNTLSFNPSLGHITTFGGNAVCCAAGLASLDVIIEEDLISRVKHKSLLIKKNLKHRLIKEIRGEGLLLAVQLSNSLYIDYVIKHAPEHGLILDYFLFCGDAFRIAPPLTISDEEIILACKSLKGLINEAYTQIKI